MKIVFSGPGSAATGALVVGVLEGNKLTPSAETLDKKIKGGLRRAIKASLFKGKAGQSLAIVTPAGTRLDRLLVVGLGKVKDMDELALPKLGGRIYAGLAASGSKAATVLVDPLEGLKVSPARMAAAIAEGACLRSYRFDKYRTKNENNSKPTLTTMTLRCRGAAKAKAGFRARDKVVQGVFLTRDLVTEPPNVIYPDSLAKRCRELAKLGVKVEVLGETRMKRLGMGALLGVGQGSARESKLVVMRWNGKRGGKRGAKSQAGKSKGGKSKADKPICFVGKGVTFDTGGISLKPPGGMEDMKYDMGGSGVVIGLMKALAGRKARVDAVGVIALAENMPGSEAQRPSDVVTSMSGQTIEVLNTDAEGRLVLADALHYANTRFKPRFIVDLATLTGAIIIALGNEYAGLFSNNDKLSERLAEAGKKVGEPVWRLPQGEAYDKMLKSDIADMKNISGGRGGGSITAAQFLGRFVGKTPWAHLDIAGVTWAKTDQPLSPKGATAFGVRLLDRLVADYYEAN